MTVVVSFEDYRPAPRYDGEAWTDVQIYEAAASTGPWTLLETQALSPVDADPQNPVYRNFTTDLGTADEQWYKLVFVDADASTLWRLRYGMIVTMYTGSCSGRFTPTIA